MAPTPAGLLQEAAAGERRLEEVRGRERADQERQRQQRVDEKRRKLSARAPSVSPPRSPNCLPPPHKDAAARIGGPHGETRVGPADHTRE
eukprot:gene13785-13964_t